MNRIPPGLEVALALLLGAAMVVIYLLFREAMTMPSVKSPAKPKSQLALLPELGSDLMEAVARQLAPRDIARLMQTCHALSAAPRHPSWEWLRTQVMASSNPGLGPWDGACLKAAGSGELEALHWAHAQGCQVDEGTLACAAAAGHLDVIRWARGLSPPCPWDTRVCWLAARGGHLAVPQWVRAPRDSRGVLGEPCPWNENACFLASVANHLEVLRWLRSQDPPCPWNARMCLQWAEAGNVGLPELVMWLRREVDALGGEDNEEFAQLVPVFAPGVAGGADAV